MKEVKMGIIACKAAPDDYAEHFTSALSPSHIYKVRRELRANLQDDERLLLDYCLTLIRTENEKNGEEQWNNAMVTVLCPERQIVLSSGTKKNKYEVWMEFGSPQYTITKREGASEPHQRQPLEKQVRTPPKQDDYAEHFTSALSPSHIYKVKRELRANLQDDERLLLEYCLTLIRTENEKNGEEQWNNAMVTVLCSERQIVLSSGTKKNKYEVWMEFGNPLYIITKRDGLSEQHQRQPLEKPVRIPPILDDYAEHFISAFSPSQIYKVKRKLGANLQDDERRLLEHCLALIRTESEENGKEQWNNAMVTVLCSERQLVLSSGTKKNKYEVWMESGNPRYKLIERDKSVKPKVPTDYKTHVSPPLKPSGIQKVQQELQEILNDNEKQLMQYCMALITDETKIKGEKQWDDVTIKILFNRRWRVVISTKSDYNAGNEYEIWMEGETRKHKMTKEEKPVTPTDYSKSITPPLKPSAIQQVQKDLRGKLNAEERQLLQHCMTMIAEESNKTGERQWKDVTITIACSRGWKIVIKTNDNTTNAYDIWMDGQTPKHKMTKQGWAEAAWGDRDSEQTIIIRRKTCFRSTEVFDIHRIEKRGKSFPCYDLIAL